MSGASERANGRASGPVLTFLFLFVPDHSVLGEEVKREKGFGQEIMKAQSVSFDRHTEKACAFLFVFSVMRKPLGVRYNGCVFVDNDWREVAKQT